MNASWDGEVSHTIVCSAFFLYFRAQVLVSDILPRVQSRFLNHRHAISFLHHFNITATDVNRVIRKVASIVPWVDSLNIPAYDRDGVIERSLLSKDGLHLSFQGTYHVASVIRDRVLNALHSRDIQSLQTIMTKTTIQPSAKLVSEVKETIPSQLTVKTEHLPDSVSKVDETIGYQLSVEKESMPGCVSEVATSIQSPPPTKHEPLPKFVVEVVETVGLCCFPTAANETFVQTQIEPVTEVGKPIQRQPAFKNKTDNQSLTCDDQSVYRQIGGGNVEPSLKEGDTFSSYE